MANQIRRLAFKGEGKGSVKKDLLMRKAYGFMIATLLELAIACPRVLAQAQSSSSQATDTAKAEPVELPNNSTSTPPAKHNSTLSQASVQPMHKKSSPIARIALPTSW